MSVNTSEAPRSVEELKVYARNCMHAIIEKYNSDGKVFADDPKSKSTGLIYRCAGAASLLLLVNGFEDLYKEDGWVNIVKNEFNKVREHIANNGFDADPLNPADLFSQEGPYCYLDSVSWVLSFALHLRLAKVCGRIKVDEIQNTAVNEVVAQCLTIIRDSACENGGWGFTQGVSKPDLYYSYAVSESLADFGDYVLGESESEIGVKRDSKLIDFLNEKDEGLISDIQRKRKLTAKLLISEYLPILGSSEIDPELEKDQPKKPHILLYYSYFVIDMLIVNLPDSFFDEDEYFKQEERSINRGIEHAVYLSRIHFDEAHATSKQFTGKKGWWDDPILSSLELSWENFEKPKLFPRMFNPALTHIFEPGLVPLSLRCNALYAFYVAKGADRKMSALFQILHDNRNETGLWDSESYSLMVTERAIEALVDYNDYLTRFEVEEIIPEPETLKESRIENVFREVVKEEVRACLAEPQQITSLRSAIAASLPAENALTENRLMEVLNDLLAKGGKYLLDGKANPSIDTKEFDIFELTFRQFLSAVLFRRLRETVPEEKQKQLKKTVDPSIDKLMDTMGPLLTGGSDVDLGQALSYLVDQADSNREKLLGGRNKV